MPLAVIQSKARGRDAAAVTQDATEQIEMKNLSRGLHLDFVLSLLCLLLSVLKHVEFATFLDGVSTCVSGVTPKEAGALLLGGKGGRGMVNN